jgi:RNA polymerase-binding transcription factor
MYMEKASLTSIELNKFEAIICARIAELERGLRRRDLIAVERSADHVDEVQQAFHLALAVSHLDRKSHQLSEARGAHRRIQEGTFGICEQCGEDINLKRLLAIPWTACCIHCQEELDRDRTRSGGNSPREGELFWGNEAA